MRSKQTGFGAATLWLILMVGAGPVSAPSSAPASSPTTASATAQDAPPTTRAALAAQREAAKAVRAAVHELISEFENRHAPGAAARETSNYFLDHPDDAVTAEAIADALQTQGGSPQAAAYIKWQLLSGLPKQDEGEDPERVLAKHLLLAYRNAPPPIARPGLTRQDQQKLDRLAQAAKPGDEPMLIETIDRAVEAHRRDNQPILAYRDELYRRLPSGPERFAAAAEDLHERVGAAADGKALAKALVADVTEWAAVDQPSPQTLMALARALRRLADTAGPQYYTTPYRNERSGVFTWRKTRATVSSARALKELAVALEEQSREPQMDLTIKDKEE